MKLQIVLAVVAVCLVASSHSAADETGNIFAAPELLMIEDAPMNESGEIMYPSPAVFDIDNDGDDELVIGSIFGGVWACENKSSSGGDPVWDQPVPVTATDGSPLELNNW
ncbi:MAG: hypothetical protein AAF456_19130 [Planctomycetota bacterium]